MSTSLAEMVTQLALSWLFQSSLVLLPACAALVALRRLGPNFEGLACRWILVGAMLTPLLTVSMQAVGLRGWQAATPSIATDPAFSESAPSLSVQLAQVKPASSLPTSTLREPGPLQVPLHAAKASPVPATIDLWPIARLLLSFSWFIASAILFVRLLGAHRLIRRIRRTADPDAELQAHCQRLADSLKVNCPAVLRTDRVASPCLVGIVRPAILIPVAHTASPGGWSQVLMHELAHVERQDVLWNGLFRFSLALLPFQPLLWWLERRHETAAEQASDDLVVQHVEEPATYAQMLLELACGQRTQLPVAVGMIARPSILSQRIRRILDEHCQHGLATSRPKILLVMLIVMFQCVAVSWLWLPAAAIQAATVQELEHTQTSTNDQEPASIERLN